jgi:hypothetical protein
MMGIRGSKSFGQSMILLGMWNESSEVYAAPQPLGIALELVPGIPGSKLL